MQNAGLFRILDFASPTKCETGIEIHNICRNPDGSRSTREYIMNPNAIIWIVWYFRKDVWNYRMLYRLWSLKVYPGLKKECMSIQYKILKRLITYINNYEVILFITVNYVQYGLCTIMDNALSNSQVCFQ